MVCAPVRSIIHSFKRVGLSTVQAHKPCSFLTCTMIPSVDLARYGASRAKNLGILGLWYKVLWDHCFHSKSG